MNSDSSANTSVEYVFTNDAADTTYPPVRPSVGSMNLSPMQQLTLLRAMEKITARKKVLEGTAARKKAKQRLRDRAAKKSRKANRK